MASSNHYKTINPATGQLVRSFPDSTDLDVSKALSTAQECFEKDWRWRTASSRAEIMTRAAGLIRDRTAQLAEIATKDMGKLYTEACYEVSLSADILEYFAVNAESFLRPTTVQERGSGAVAEVVSEPIGIIVAVEPWNYPYYQLARVAGPQLMAGNVVLAKHAASVPQCALAFAKIFEDAGAPPGAYTNIFGSRSQMNQLVDDFRVRGVTLTGSEAAGAGVAERAGRHLKKVVLELGGSDPFVVLEDANLEAAISRASSGRLVAMGQVCAAPKRFIVVGKERGDLFLEGVKQHFSSLEAGDPMDPKTTIGPVFSESALQTLLEQIHRAVEHGATLVCGGKRIDRPGFYLEPTILTNISAENPIYKEEMFGPVAMMFSVDTDDAAVELANATRYGLGSSVNSEDPKHARAVADRIDAGMVFINSCTVTLPELPFGGIKNSGFGRELSDLGFSEFLNKKLIRMAPTN
ncbi:NAD-dependent succinate-semialdehyde dehydrogenase [Aspergillus chevalieri]|uniref:Aldehyde dehydrogenase domain-containing protein n=1 Tax=Aspergillus chevalieri TaxID=182096 RepID=A0A7R7VNF1_ASPCH|nr:uncharacterized protein ACHE_40358S [Aspergillus chevalieri]BCR87794.1 hypothetical protein ACHE_40358S [Aspergillus chevalieri]